MSASLAMLDHKHAISTLPILAFRKHPDHSLLCCAEPRMQLSHPLF